jgi:4-amino-4-deoxy-L-arabinose transferase-like glycosyltransferase
MSTTTPNRLQLRQKLVAVLAITALGAFFRLYRIEVLPPGDGHDPAAYGVDALQILQGERPIFFPSNYGREALFSYLVVPFVAAWGPVALAVHVASAVVGILTIPAVYLLAEELFAEEREPLRSFGGLAAASMMATSYWHLNWSRYGVRAILLPLFAALVFAFLWRGLRTGCRWAFIACGIALGLSLYTYQAARLLPVLVVLVFLYRAIERRSLSRRDVASLITVVVVSLIAFAPLGHYFITHPGSFSERVSEASVIDESQNLATNLEVLWNRLEKTLLMFSFQGDREPFSTIPGRPVLNPVFSLLFYAGIVLSLWRLKRPTHRFVVSWLVLMLLPAVFGGQAPAAKRAIGTLPAVASLIGIGALESWSLLREQKTSWPVNRTRVINSVCVGLLVGGFAYSSYVTYRDYFVTWASNRNLPAHFQVGISAIGDYIRTLPSTERIYVSPDLPDHPGILFHSGLRDGIRGYNGRVCLVAPAQTLSLITYLIVPSKDKDGISRLQEYYPQGQVVYEGPANIETPYFRAYRVPAKSRAQISPANPTSVQWADHIELLGYDLDTSEHHAGDDILIRLYFRGLAPMKRNLTVFVHLLGSTNPATGSPLWAQDDSEPCRNFYPTSVWDVGEIIVDTYAIELPEAIPPGDYTLNTGFYQLMTMERLPLTRGPSEHNAAMLERIRISGAQ